MTGTLANNPHEGSRSEYLAQYALSALGTVAPVPHQEDTGIDLYCTLLERHGKVSIPTDYYCVQVKSDTAEWRLDTKKAVEWLVTNPLPLLLCVVIKSEARVLVYPTLPRFDVWRQPLLPSRLYFSLDRQTSGTVGQYDEKTGMVPVYAPALNFTVSEMLDQDWVVNAKAVLKSWLHWDRINLASVVARVPTYKFPPLKYSANRPLPKNCIGDVSRAKEHPEVLAKMKKELFPQLAWLARQLVSHGEAHGALMCFSLLRQLRADDSACLGPYLELCKQKNWAAKIEGNASKGMDALHEKVQELIHELIEKLSGQ